MTEPDATTTRFAQFLGGLTLADLEAELEETLRQKQQLDAQEELLEMAIQWKRAASRAAPDTPGSSPLARSTPEERPSSLRAAIVRVLARADRALRPVEIYTELESQGWAPKGKNAKNQLAARLSRMVAAGELRRNDGKYSPAILAKTGDPGEPPH